jgi:hypothetical protein
MNEFLKVVEIKNVEDILYCRRIAKDRDVR